MRKSEKIVNAKGIEEKIEAARLKMGLPPRCKKCGYVHDGKCEKGA